MVHQGWISEKDGGHPSPLNVHFYFTKRVMLFMAIVWVVVTSAVAEPIPIGSIQELQKIGNDLAYPLDGEYILTHDIDASETAWWNGIDGFEPIGSPFQDYFTGSFDGQGHVISELYIRRTEVHVGLFGDVGAGARISNLGLVDGIISGDWLVGALAGFNDGGTITRCYSTCVVSGNNTVAGGLIGYSNGTIAECFATGEVSVSLSAGGLVGYNEGVVEGSHASGGVSGRYDIGGLLGYNRGTVMRSYCSGAVLGYNYTGGFCGVNKGVVSACFSVGSVIGKGSYTGGLIGCNYSGSVSQCYSAGKVLGYGYGGGLVGDSDTTVIASFWDIETSGQSESSGGGTGITTAQLLQSSTFAAEGWDYDVVWTQIDGATVPHFSAGDVPGTVYTLDMSIEGDGTVSSSGGSYPAWSIVWLTVVPGADSVFSGWLGDGFISHTGAQISDLPVIMHDDISLKALFLSKNPFSLFNVADLYRIGRSPYYPLWRNYKLVRDIGPSTISCLPIGDFAFPFTGTFDGQGHVISGIRMHETSENSYAQGLFGYIGPGGKVENLQIADIMVGSNCYYYAGGLAGVNEGVIQGCTVSGATPICGNYGGGMVGTNRGMMLQCSVSGSVFGTSYAGGVTGLNEGTMVQCSMSGNVSGEDLTGGVIGENNKGLVSLCFSEGIVTGRTSEYFDAVGGVVGANYGSVSRCYSTALILGGNKAGGLAGINASQSTITQCYATGAVIGENYSGGLVGENFGTTHYCYATGMVDGKVSAGGLVGDNTKGSVEECYAIGAVSGLNAVGGLVARDTGTISRSFWDVETSGQSGSDGGTGISTAQLLQSSTFLATGWNYSTLWAQLDGQTVPYFAYFAPPGTAYSLTTVIAGDGTISPSEGTFPAWSFLTLTNTPGDGYVFAGWCGEGFYNNTAALLPVLPIVLSGTITLTALFFPDAPISLYTIEDLQKIGNDRTFPLTWRYRLENDVDASGTSQWNSGKGFLPIGNSLFPFTGILDGQGHVISGLNIKRPEENFVGLFGKIGASGRIENLGLAGGTVSGYIYTGGLAGWTEGTFSACYSGISLSGMTEVGSLIGRNNGEVTGCYALGGVTGKSLLGGLIGHNTGSVQACHATGNITGGSTAGGLIGRNSGLVEQCHALGAVSGEDSIGGLVGVSHETVVACYGGNEVLGDTHVGGLIGKNYENIVWCYATGTVSGTEYVGGLIGENRYGLNEKCYAAGSVSGANYIGGLIGGNNSCVVKQCYAACAVNGDENAGGLIGYAYNGPAVQSYWDIEVSGQASSAEGIGKTTVEMIRQATFSGWDFTTVWDIVEDASYPFLREWTGAMEGEEEEGEGVTEGQSEGEGTVAEGAAEEGEGVGEGEVILTLNADEDGDGQIDLSELLRMIQLYNSQGYHCEPGTEDGFAPGLGDRTCRPHNSDYAPQDWSIGLSEILRVFQFRNTGGYHYCPGDDTEDGFCLGLA